MLSIPHRAQDDKFTNSIEGYRGSIHKLGRLLAHDWFSITFDNTTKERYLFLFKARILICKVRRISEDRSVFQLKDIVRVSFGNLALISFPAKFHNQKYIQPAKNARFWKTSSYRFAISDVYILFT